MVITGKYWSVVLMLCGASVAVAAAQLAATSASSPGSKIGISPCRSRAIFAASWSTQITDTPNSEKHAPDTRPTYPVPIIAIRIRSIPRAKGASQAQPPVRPLA